jgi:hypothetical protein
LVPGCERSGVSGLREFRLLSDMAISVFVPDQFFGKIENALVLKHIA